MGCIYSGMDGCNMWDKDEDPLDERPNGCATDGGCMVEDDPDPSSSCDSYESDSTCFNCGADYNQDEECSC